MLLREKLEETAQVTTPAEASAPLLTFPGARFKAQTSKSTWEGGDICPNPDLLTTTGEKQSNVVHIIW